MIAFPFRCSGGVVWPPSRVLDEHAGGRRVAGLGSGGRGMGYDDGGEGDHGHGARNVGAGVS